MVALYNKYRPANLSELVGNEDIKKNIGSAIQSKKPMPHSYLFTGSSGCGKTTLARIMAKYFGATAAGIKEINSADVTGVDAIREIIRQADFPNPASPKATVYILDECHKLSNAAQNALLKTLEEPPAHAYFILCTTDPDKIIATIQTRLTHYHLQEPSEEELADLLIYVCGEEAFDYEDDALIEIINKSGSSPRQALSLLQTCSGFLSSPAKVKEAVKGKGLFMKAAGGDWEAAASLVKLMQRGNWEAVAAELKKHAKDGAVRDVEQGVTNYLGQQLLYRGNNHARIAQAILRLNAPIEIYGHALFYARMYQVFCALNAKPSAVK